MITRKNISHRFGKDQCAKFVQSSLTLNVRIDYVGIELQIDERKVAKQVGANAVLEEIYGEIWQAWYPLQADILIAAHPAFIEQIQEAIARFEKILLKPRAPAADTPNDNEQRS